MDVMKSAVLMFTCCATMVAADLPVGPIAHIGFRVADLEKTRAFYSGRLGLPQTYDQKDAAGKVTLAVFMINDNQFLEFSPGSPVGFTHVAFVTEKIEGLREMVAALGLNPPELRTGRDRTRNFSIQDPERHRIEFVQHEADSMQAQSRGKFPLSSTVSGIRHVGIPYTDRGSAEAFLHRLFPGSNRQPVAILPAGATVRIAFEAKVPNSSLRDVRRDPDGTDLEFLNAASR
jgi:catechol 2,3-dioxygenase-like lactoylglutathione lyase family enzyme